MNKNNLLTFALFSAFAITNIKGMEGSNDQQNPKEGYKPISSDSQPSSFRILSDATEPFAGEWAPRTQKLQEMQAQLEQERQQFDFDREEMQKVFNRERRRMDERNRERDQEAVDLKERVVIEEKEKSRKIIEELKSENAALKLAMEQTDGQMPQYTVQQIIIALESNLEQERETNRHLLERQEEMEDFIVSKLKSALGFQEQRPGGGPVDYLAIKNEIENLGKQDKTLKVQIVDKDK